MINYRAGQREVMRWLTGYGIKLAKVEDLGMQNDDGWDHFAWSLTVVNNYDHNQTAYVFPFNQGLAHTDKPTLVDIISALLSDASCVLSARDFEDFASNLGYDPDSRKAEKIYHQIIRNNAKLCKLFRTTDLDELLTKYEPLREKAGL